jgi:hypothetical protein
MVSGTTVHGAQHFKPQPSAVPLTYYVADGPFGDVMKTFGAATDHIGVVGLGAGAMASYLVEGQAMTFYEIDPAVVDLANDPHLFTFTADSPGQVDFIVGDGRLTLEQPHPPYGLLVIDAFSSDAIPTHLLTVEAVREYLGSISSSGVIVFHISNRHLDLEPVLGRIAQELGLEARVTSFNPPTAEGSPTAALAMARSAKDFGMLAFDTDWVPPRVGTDLWTDSFTNLLRIIRWG